MPGEVERKYGGLLEKKWTSVIRLQKKVKSLLFQRLFFLESSALSALKNSTLAKRFFVYIGIVGNGTGI